MENNFEIRAYRPADKETVINLLRLNTPMYFSSEEENDLIYYLENEICAYYVIETEGTVVGSGGYNLTEDKIVGTISWDILHPDWQRKSLGTALLVHRTNELNKIPEVKQIVVRTSQLAYKFYERAGFQLVEIVDNYWAQGYHLYQMELPS